MGSNDIATTAMWDNAVTSQETVDRIKAVTAATVALSGTWPFLAVAESVEEFDHRLALMQDQIVGRTPPEVLDEVVANLREKFTTLHRARLEERTMVRTAARTIAKSEGEQSLPQAYVHVHKHGSGDDEYFQVDHVAGPTFLNTIAHASSHDDAMATARQFALPNGLPLYENGKYVEGKKLRSLFRQDEEFFDQKTGRWVRASELPNITVEGMQMTSVLIPGHQLNPSQREQVGNAFVYRWTSDNPHRTRAYRPCPSCDIKNPAVADSAEGHNHPTIPLQSDNEWLASHAFHFNQKGNLHGNHRYAEPYYGDTKEGSLQRTAHQQWFAGGNALHPAAGIADEAGRARRAANWGDSLDPIQATNYQPDPDASWRYHPGYQFPGAPAQGGQPTAPVPGPGIAQPTQQTSVDTDGFPIDLAQGEYAGAAAKIQEQITPGQWVAPPGGWPAATMPNAATGMPEGQRTSGRRDFSQRTASGPYTHNSDTFPAQGPGKPRSWVEYNEYGGVKHSIPHEQMQQILANPQHGWSAEYEDHPLSEMVHATGPEGTYHRYVAHPPKNQRVGSRTASDGNKSTDDFYTYNSGGHITSGESPYKTCPSCHGSGGEYSRCTTCDGYGTLPEKRSSRHTAQEGIVPTPGPNPNYFGQGTQGLQGPAQFPEDVTLPEHNNHQDGDGPYGDVPPVQSGGSVSDGTVDGQGYSRQGARGPQKTRFAPGYPHVTLHPPQSFYNKDDGHFDLQEVRMHESPTDSFTVGHWPSETARSNAMDYADQYMRNHGHSSHAIPFHSVTASGRRLGFSGSAGERTASGPMFRAGDRVLDFRGDGATVHKVYPSAVPGKSHRVQVRWDDHERNLTWDGKEHPEGAGDQRAYYEEGFKHHPEGELSRMVDSAVPYEHELAGFYSSRVASTDGRIVGQCDHCGEPVRFHTEGGGHLRHLHNSSPHCKDGKTATAVRVQMDGFEARMKLARFVEARHADHDKDVANHYTYGRMDAMHGYPFRPPMGDREHAAYHDGYLEGSQPPPAMYAPRTGAAMDHDRDYSTDITTPDRGVQCPNCNGNGYVNPLNPSVCGVCNGAQRVPKQVKKDFVERTRRQGAVLENPTAENPTGRGADPYRARVDFEGFEKQRPRQRMEDMNANTPTSAPTPIKTGPNANTPLPGSSLDDDGPRERGDQEEEDDDD